MCGVRVAYVYLAARCGSRASVVHKHGGGSPELAENVAYMQCMCQCLPEMEEKELVMRDSVKEYWTKITFSKGTLFFTMLVSGLLGGRCRQAFFL